MTACPSLGCPVTPLDSAHTEPVRLQAASVSNAQHSARTFQVIRPRVPLMAAAMPRSCFYSGHGVAVLVVTCACKSPELQREKKEAFLVLQPVIIGGSDVTALYLLLAKLLTLTSQPLLPACPVGTIQQTRNSKV